MTCAARMRGVLWIWAGLLGVAVAPASALSPWLHGLHWYRTDGDVEDLTGERGVWLLETVMVWDGGWSASAQKSKFQTAVARGHTIICRVQPYWGYAVPIESQMPGYLSSIAQTAETLKNECCIWQIGNEMNSTGEYGGQYLEPTDYVQRFKQIRAAIKSVQSPLGEQMVLLGPPSVLSQYWHEMLSLLEPGDIDGLTMHAYGTTPDNTDIYRNVQNFMEAVTWQLDWIDAAGGKNNMPGAFQNIPVFITEFDRCNHPANDPVQEQTGSQFLYRAYAKLHDWNTAQGDYTGMDTHPVVTAIWFIYPEEASNWDCYSLVVHKAGPRGKDVNLWDAFQYAADQEYPAGVTAPILSVMPETLAHEVVHQSPLTQQDEIAITNTWLGGMDYTVTSDMPWLIISPAGGSVSEETDVVMIQYDTTGLPVGDHSATVTVASPQAANSPQTIDVIIEVINKPADMDGDGDVDQADFGLFQACYTGMGQIQSDPDCQDALLDTDRDVDQDDFGIFQNCISGTGINSSPICDQ